MIWSLFFVALAWSLIRTGLAAHPLFDADSLYIPELWQRMHDGGHLGTWCLAPNPSIWPDLGLWHGTHWLGDGIQIRMSLYGLVSGMALIWFSARLLRAIQPMKRLHSLGWVAAGLALGLAMDPKESFVTWMAPAHQGTPFIATLWLWARVLERDQEKLSQGAWFNFVFGLGLLLGSSKFLGILGLIPALVLNLRSSHRAWLWFALPPVLVLAWLELRFFKSLGSAIPVLRPNYFFMHWSEQGLGFLKGLPQALIQDGRGLILAAMAGLLAWLLLAWRERSLWAFILLPWALASGAGMALCFYFGSASGRFLTIFVWLPVLFLPYFIARLFPPWAKPMLLFVALCALLTLRETRLAAQPHPALLQAQWIKELCLQRGWREGWAEYWAARPLRILGDPSPVVLPVVPDQFRGVDVIAPYYVVVDRHLFPPLTPLPRPDFVVINGLPEDRVLAYLGKPFEKIQGQGLSVWVYAKEKR